MSLLKTQRFEGPGTMEDLGEKGLKKAVQKGKKEASDKNSEPGGQTETSTQGDPEVRGQWRLHLKLVHRFSSWCWRLFSKQTPMRLATLLN